MLLSSPQNLSKNMPWVTFSKIVFKKKLDIFLILQKQRQTHCAGLKNIYVKARKVQVALISTNKVTGFVIKSFILFRVQRFNLIFICLWKRVCTFLLSSFKDLISIVNMCGLMVFCFPLLKT